MIFDTPAAHRLIKRFKNAPAYNHPYAVSFLLKDTFRDEREYLESLCARAPEATALRWVSLLLSPRDSHHLSAWFELMLYGWLSALGKVTPEPQVSSGRPDFLLELQQQSIFIEAYAHLRPEAERTQERRVGQLFTLLKRFNYPYIINIQALTITAPLDEDAFSKEVHEWLSLRPHEFLLYREPSGNQVGMSADPNPAPHLGTQAMMISDVAVSHIPLRNPLHAKAKKYKDVRYVSPYVIALFLESSYLSAEEVAAAWFGRTQSIIDVAKASVIDTRVDRTGLHFHLNQVRHTSVSATLVFSASWSDKEGRRSLSASYIQNPYAILPLDPAIFPLRRQFVATGRSARAITMTWLPDSPDE